MLKAKNGFIERIKEHYDRLQLRNDLLIGGKHKGKGTKAHGRASIRKLASFVL